jgi:rSAM/selenodomain-associated transferase 2
MYQLSIIIPTLNEEACLAQTLQHLQYLSPRSYEIIVADGGSSDNTKYIASRFAVKFLETGKTGRAAQMNAGAAQATGEYLCFLHADTEVPADLVKIIGDTLQDPRISLGSFVSVMGSPTNIHYFTTALNYSKTWLGPLLYSPYRCLFKGLRLLFGDQAMFCRNHDFRQVGGFDDDMLIMEEAYLCDSMNQLGKIVQLPQRVYTSDRRIARLGFWKAHAIYLGIFLLWTLGVSPEKLHHFYKNIR